MENVSQLCCFSYTRNCSDTKMFIASGETEVLYRYLTLLNIINLPERLHLPLGETRLIYKAFGCKGAKLSHNRSKYWQRLAEVMGNDDERFGAIWLRIAAASNQSVRCWPNDWFSR